ncbi:MAG: hypothetical protein J0M12_11470 [Deltaproteobacteria bacterium]|nr:hypothetical protein [Deltaproteobacteria bacterium]
MSRSALQLVDSVPFTRKTLEVSFDSSQNEDSHSLHYSLSFPDSFPAEIPSFFINKYSRRGDVVLDPFCGAGATALESAVLGRTPYASDANPLAARVTQAKLEPADLTEVTLALQMLNLRRPIDLKIYNEFFSPFYDIDTFRELLHLREFVHSTDTPTAKFLELVALSLLHGHTAGYFSAYSLPQVALTPEKQKDLNNKRHQTPDYRAVMPRILRKTASILRDGIPSVIRQQSARSKVFASDARDLSYIDSGTVNLIVTAPPLPGEPEFVQDLWLKLWFSGIQSRSFADRLFSSSTVEGWKEYMNEVLLESARVTRSGSRGVFVLRAARIDNKSILLDEELMNLVEENLSRYWEPESILVHHEKTAKLKDAQAERDQRKVHQRNRVLVLRRR